jgi:hypothetical protein
MMKYTKGASSGLSVSWLLPIFGLAAWLGAPISTLQLSAQTLGYCAFEINVKSPEAAPIQGISVSASSGDGSPFARTVSDDEGIARICDSPVSSDISISAGSGGCGEVTVRNLYPLWLETRRIYVIVQGCLQRENLFAHECHVVVRIRDERNAPVEGVQLTGREPSTGTKETAVSDRFGRLFRVVPLHGTFAGRLEKAGYVTAGLALECGPRSAPEDERTVVLSPSRRH